MTIKTHCDNDKCGEYQSGDEHYGVYNARGEVVMGWWTIGRGDDVWHFHSIHCLQQWAFDRATKDSLKADISR